MFLNKYLTTKTKYDQNLNDSNCFTKYIRTIISQDNKQLLGDCKLTTDTLSKLGVLSCVSSQLESWEVTGWQSVCMWSFISEVEWLPPVPSLTDRDLDDWVRALDNEDEDACGVTEGAGCLDVIIRFNAPNCAWHADIKGR